MQQVKMGIARELLKQKNFGQVALIANDILAHSPEDVEALWLLSTAHYELGDDKSAERNLRRYLQRDPYSVDALIRLAKCIKRQGRIAESISLIDTFLNNKEIQNTANEAIFAELSALYLDQGNSDQAMIYANRSLNLNSNNVLANMVLGAIFILLGTAKEAIKYLLIAREGAPSDPQVHINLASAYELTSETDKQIKSLELALMCDSSLIGLYLAIAKSYVQLGNAELAEQNFTHYLQRVSDDLEARSVFAHFLQSERRYIQAIEQWLLIVKQRPDQLSAWQELECCFRLTGEVEKAGKCSHQIEKIKQQNNE